MATFKVMQRVPMVTPRTERMPNGKKRTINFTDYRYEIVEGGTGLTWQQAKALRDAGANRDIRKE